jgi:hypothetical protein
VQADKPVAVAVALAQLVVCTQVLDQVDLVHASLVDQAQAVQPTQEW